MSTQPLSPLSRLWFKWKSLSLPWRKRRLAGMDLAGTTYWEFKDGITSNRFRRIAQHNPKIHYSDIQISPQWHQWLRHTRAQPPSISEQELDVQRQSQLKYLARLADERWASKPSVLDGPTARAQLETAALLKGTGEKAELEIEAGSSGFGSGKNGNLGAQEGNGKKGKENPWNVRTGAPGEQWQPEAWNPPATKRQE